MNKQIEQGRSDGAVESKVPAQPGISTVAIPLVSGEELLARTQPLPKWIDDMKGSGPTTDSLIEYIEQLSAGLPVQHPVPGAAVVVKDFDIEDAQVLFSAAENMRSADKTGPVVDARFRIAYKVEQIAKRMFAQPAQQPAPIAEHVGYFIKEGIAWVQTSSDDPRGVKFYAAPVAAPVAGQVAIDLIVRDIAELDYSSDISPDLMQVTAADLRSIIERYLAPAPASSVQPLFDRKLSDLEQRGYQVIGRILHKDGEYALFDSSCRWLSKEQYQRLMHEQDGSLFASVQPFQQRVQPWMIECFGAEISADTKERNHRFFEESTELVQAHGMTASEAHQLVDYVYGRPVGEPAQEVGGAMVTLAALCLARGLDMHAAGETELARIWTKVEAIRAKQAAKPKHSPLPAPPNAEAPIEAALAAFCDQEGYPSDGPMDDVLRKAFAAGAGFAFDWKGGA